MNQAPFQHYDLEEFEELLERASAVFTMREAFLSPNRPGIALRHDVDNAIEPAVRMAEWEAARGYRSTYFILHTAPYWQEKDILAVALETIMDCGHEIGFHLNAIPIAIRTGRSPVEIAAEALSELRGYAYDVTGVVAHGDSMCHHYGFNNDEIFTECRRHGNGAADRRIGDTLVTLKPVSRMTLGLEYDPNWLSRAGSISDSGGHWSTRFEDVTIPYKGQLHILQHPDWWADAFTPEKAIV